MNSKLLGSNDTDMIISVYPQRHMEQTVLTHLKSKVQLNICINSYIFYVLEIPVMRSNDGGRSSINTCTIDTFMMNLMVAVLVYPHLPRSLIDSEHQIHNEVYHNVT